MTTGWCLHSLSYRSQALINNMWCSVAQVHCPGSTNDPAQKAPKDPHGVLEQAPLVSVSCPLPAHQQWGQGPDQHDAQGACLLPASISAPVLCW